MAQQIHVVPEGELWAVERDDGTRDGTFAAEEAAIEVARRIAEGDGLDLVVHGADGQTRLRSDPGR